MKEKQKEISERFKKYIQEIGYSKGSQYQIPRCVQEFLEQVNKTNTKTIKNIERQDILDFYHYLQSRPLKRREGVLSESMINHYLFSLKTFFTWLEQSGEIHHNPISNLKFKRYRSNTRQPLSQQEIQQLFKSTTTLKETAVLHLFYSCGLRRTEGEYLNSNDIHFSKKLLYVREGKGAKRRVIPITERVRDELEAYLNKEKSLIPNCKNKEAFMVNSNGERMRGDSYNKVLKQILSRTTINQEITLHHLRHSIATHLLENGVSIELVRDFLGHSHLESTQIYAKVFKHQLKKL